MPTLQHLDGRPQTWAELHARLEAYYAQFVPVETPRIEDELSWRCRNQQHSYCSGGRLRDGYYACECVCHPEAA